MTMYKTFFLIIGTIVVLNLFLVLVPDNKYEKYISFVVGLVVMLVVAQTFFNQDIRISLEDFQFDGVNELENSKVSAVALEQWIEGIAEGNLSGEIKVKVYKHGAEIQKIEIQSDYNVTEEEILWLSKQCDINREKFLVK